MMAGCLELPAHLRDVFFGWRWETAKVWALPTPASHLPFQDLAWHLDLTVWTTVPGQPLFDLAPTTVLATPASYPRHWSKIQSAGTAYPLELFRNGPRWVILDGYHRLCAHALRGSHSIPVRFHPDEHRDLVQPRKS